MNGQRGRGTSPQDKPATVIQFRRRSYAIQEAGTLAVREQTLGNLSAAIDIYNLILAKAPDYADVYNNRGVTLHVMRRYEDALASYDKAIALKPNYAEAHTNRGATLHALKRYVEALASCDRAIALKPDCAEIHTNRGVTLHALKRYVEALATWDRAIALKPDCAEGHTSRGVALHALKRYDDALASHDQAIALRPDCAEAHSNRGATLQTMKRYDDALASCDKAIALKPDYAEAWNNRGLFLANKGDMAGAEKMCLKALALRSDYPDPLFNLANIRHYQDAEHADIQHIHRLLDGPGTSPEDREHLYFTLGKMYDDCGRYDEAFKCYRQANQLRNGTVSYDAEGVVAVTDNMLDVFSKDFLAQPFTGASDGQSPLFIVGMPRSGTTLLAAMLSNHRDIDTAGELESIMEFTVRLPELIGESIPYPQAVRHITQTIASRLAQDYEKRLRRDTGANVSRVIDKHPLNFRHLGFIAKLFPKSQIIHCTRHPLDTGLSNYFQRFTPDYDYSFDLRNIGHFYGEYVRLMEHWRKALPRRMIEVRYEDMILNTEPMVRRTLGVLGLDWDERCLSPHTNPCAVETASQWQVRRPIYQQSVERWRHYDKHLAPLREMLAMTGQIPV